MVRTRFAPSPTGALHVGGIRTALFAWLVAKQGKGQFVVRIEDTDQAREVDGAVTQIINSLKALGLDYDEGPDKQGEYGPYYQSKRLEIYKKWADKLIESGRAYADPYSSEEVQKFRESAQSEKKPFLYRNHRPDAPPAWDGSQPLRFKSDPKAYSWHDEVMGSLSTGPEVVDDFILIKSDGFPTYNFAHIVDDAEMKISHVIRGQEFISSMPNYLNLYEALGITPPIFATMPHILAPSGNKKLSKRDGAKDILDYVNDGYLPEALISFIATLGWNDGTEQETFTREELIQKFSLSRVGRSGAHFDEHRLNWVNGHFIRNLSQIELMTKAEKYWGSEAADANSNLKNRVLEVSKDRLKKLSDLPTLTHYFFKLAQTNEEVAKEINELFRVHGAEGAPTPVSWLRQVESLISAADANEPGSYEEPLKVLIEKTIGQPLVLYGSIRIALTGAPQTPSVWETIYALGKETAIQRLENAISALEK